jgi:hypothetical protein
VTPHSNSDVKKGKDRRLYLFWSRMPQDPRPTVQAMYGRADTNGTMHVSSLLEKQALQGLAKD